MTDYTARVERSGKFWIIHLVELGQYTQARSLDEVEEMARSLASLWTETDPSQVSITVDLRLPQEVEVDLAESRRLREVSASANSESAQRLRSAARALAEAGVPRRDIGTALGVTRQRVHQLTH